MANKDGLTGTAEPIACSPLNAYWAKRGGNRDDSERPLANNEATRMLDSERAERILSNHDR